MGSPRRKKPRSKKPERTDTTYLDLRTQLSADELKKLQDQADKNVRSVRGEIIFAVKAYLEQF